MKHYKIFYYLFIFNLFILLFIPSKVSAQNLTNLNTQIGFSEADLKNGYNYENSYNKNIEANVDILDSEALSVDSFIICGKKVGQDYIHYPYIALFKEDKTIFELTLNQYKWGEFTDLLVEDDKIIVVGNFELDQYEVISIFEFNLDGEITKMVTFPSDHDSYGYKILSLKNEYIAIGATYSKDYYHSNNTGIKSMVTIRLNKNDFDDNFVLAFGNSESLDFHNAVSDDESFYILATSSGKGYFTDGLRNKFLLLIKMDYHLDCPEYLSLYDTDILKTSKMVIYQDHICFVEIKKGNIMAITSYTKDLEFINIDYYNDYYLPNIISSFNAYSDSSYLAISLYAKANNKLYERRIILNNDFKEIFNQEYLYDITDKIKHYHYKNNLFFQIIKNDNYKIASSFFIKEIGDNVYINGRLTNSIISQNNNDNNLFGTILEEHLIDYNGIEIIYNKEVEIKLETNIIPYSTYDKGVTLNFNAKGYLNGEEILSGYQVSTPGQYLLELLGNNNVKEQIFFTVGKLSIDTSEVSVIEEFKTNNFNINKLGEDFSQKTNKIITPITIGKVSGNYNYYYLIIILILGLLIGILISKKWRKKNE